MTQQEIIKKVLADTNGWTPSYKLIMVETQYGWLGSSGDRRARELYEAGEILRRQNGKYAEYKTKEVQRENNHTKQTLFPTGAYYR